MRGSSQRLILAALAGLLVAGSLQFVGASGGLRAEAPLEIPGLVPGDRGEYSVRLVYRDGSDAGALAGFWENYAFRILPDDVDRDAAGRLHAVGAHDAQIRFHPGGQYSGSLTRVTVDRFSGEPVTQTFRWSDGGRAPLSLQGLSASEEVRGQFTVFQPEAALCGLRSSLQDARVDADQRVTLDGGCGPAGPLEEHGRYPFRVDGQDQVVGVRAWRFVSDADPRVAAWYAPGLPVPVQLRLPAVAEGVLRPQYDMIFELVSFERGATVAPSAAVESVPSGQEHLKARAWHPLHGPAATTVDHPYPIADAVRDARADPRAASFVLYLRDHPDAYLVAAHGQTVMDGLATHEWDLEFTDGKEGIRYLIQRTAGVNRYSELPTNIHAVWAPSLAQMPAQLPAVADILERWTLIRDVPAGDVAYGYGIRCGAPGCPAVEVVVHVGENNLVGERRQTDLLAVAHDGEVLYRVRHDSQSVPILADLGLTNAPPTPEDAPGRLSLLSPSPRLAAAVATGLVATLLVWLAPLLKSAPWSGLFSRVKPAQVLEHPVRQQILDAVHAEPGIHFQELTRRVERGRGVVGHHLAKLEEAGLVQSVHQYGYLCLFPPGSAASERRAAGAVKAPAAQRILGAVRDSPGVTTQDLAQQLHLSPSTVHGHVQRLLGAGLVEQWPDGRRKRLRPTRAAFGVGAA